MATPVITNLDNVNHTYTADGVNYALDPSTGRYAVASTIKPVANANLQNASPVTIPTTQATPPPAQLFPSQDLIAQNSANMAAEQNFNDQTSALKTLQDQYAGKGTDTLALEQQQGIPQISQNVLDLQAKADQLALEYNTTPYSLAGQGRGITTGILRGQEAVKQRQLAIDGMYADAQLKAAQGKLSLAQSQVDRAIALKYDPILQKIENQKTILENAKFMLSRSDQKLATAKQAELDRLKQEQEDKKATEQGIQSIGLTLRKYGVSDAVVQSVLNSKTVNDAIVRAGNNLQDPQAKLEIQKLWGDIQINKMQMQKEQYNIDLLKKYGSTDPKEIKASKDNLINAKNSYAETQAQMDAIEVLKTAPGLSTRVGTSLYSRTPLGVGGAIGKSILPGSSMTADLQAKLSGSGQEFSASIHNLTKGLTLDTLIKAKQNGATFGALSIPELNMLAETATKINDWEIKDDKGNGTGVWNIDEASFVRELDRIQGLYKKALIQSQGKIISPDESSQLDSIFPQSVEPSNYYGI